jgi:hypothetical protein
MIYQCLHNFTNSRETNQVNQLSHVHLAINAAPGHSPGSSLFKIIYSQNVHLLPAVRIYSTNVLSAIEYALSMMKIQQEGHNRLELTRACQTSISRDRLKPVPPLIPKQDTVLVHSVPYLKALEKKPKITSL